MTRKRDVLKTVDEEIGARVAEARKRLGWSQSDLAQHVVDAGPEGAVRHQTVYEVEKGKRSIPLSELPRWCDALGVTPDWLGGWGEDIAASVREEAAAYRRIAAIVEATPRPSPDAAASLPDAKNLTPAPKKRARRKRGGG